MSSRTVCNLMSVNHLTSVASSWVESNIPALAKPHQIQSNLITQLSSSLCMLSMASRFGPIVTALLLGVVDTCDHFVSSMSWLLTIVYLNTNSAISCWLLAEDFLSLRTSGLSSSPHRLSTDVIPPCWYVEFDSTSQLPSLRHDARRPRFGSTEVCVLVIGPSWIRLFHEFVKLVLPKCNLVSLKCNKWFFTMIAKLVLPKCNLVLPKCNKWFNGYDSLLPKCNIWIVSTVGFIDRSLPSCRDWVDIVFLIGNIIDRLLSKFIGRFDRMLPRCLLLRRRNKWIDWVLPTCRERFVRVHGLFDPSLPKCKEWIMRFIDLVKLKLPKCNFVLRECNKLIWVDRTDAMLLNCSQWFNQQVAGVRDLALPNCNGWITWFDHSFHSSRMYTLMDCLLPKCSNSISRIVGLLSSWTASFCMISSMTWFTHLMLECVKIRWPRITCGSYVFPVPCLFA